MTPRDRAPLLLALCSATRTASVALLRGDELVLELQAEEGMHQAESLLPLVDTALTRAGVGLAELDGYAIAIGPGSFTSLRIGLATLKGLAFGSDAPAIPVSTLQAVAALDAGKPGRLLIATLDAQREEVYAAAYRCAEEGWAPVPELLGERVYTADELAERVPANAILVGPGAAIVCEALRERLGPGVEMANAGAAEPSAAAVGRLAATRLERGEGVAIDALAPRYVRRAEAEVTRTSQRFEDDLPAG